MHVLTRARLCYSVSSFNTHFAQVLWYLRSSWMMEYSGPHLVSHLAISVTAIYLSSSSRALTCLILSTVREMFGRPQRSSSAMFILQLWKLSTYWFTFLCVIQFFPYYANILPWISEDFTLCDHKNRMTARCSIGLQSEGGADMFTLWCTSFTERNGYPTTCLDLAQHVIGVMFARAQCGKLS